MRQAKGMAEFMAGPTDPPVDRLRRLPDESLEVATVQDGSAGDPARGLPRGICIEVKNPRGFWISKLASGDGKAIAQGIVKIAAGIVGVPGINVRRNIGFHNGTAEAESLSVSQLRAIPGLKIGERALNGIVICLIEWSVGGNEVDGANARRIGQENNGDRFRRSCVAPVVRRSGDKSVRSRRQGLGRKGNRERRSCRDRERAGAGKYLDLRNETVGILGVCLDADQTLSM